jgi:AmiR/NasT family two-component response regulator
MRILIAEDDPVIGLGLAKRVAALGHEPLGPACDGEEAVVLARAEHPDLYLFDVDMPLLDGLSAARTLAAEGLRRPVVVITGVREPDLIDRCVADGVSAYLSKPIDDRQLDASIRLAATRHAEIEALEAEVSKAQRALVDRKVVERAKAVLIETMSLTEPEAFRRLQRAARDRNASVADVARDILEREDLLRGRPERTAG